MMYRNGKPIGTRYCEICRSSATTSTRKIDVDVSGIKESRKEELGRALALQMQSDAEQEGQPERYDHFWCEYHSPQRTYNKPAQGKE